MAEELDSLTEQIHEASIPNYLQTKGEIVEYYKDTYGANWASQAARDLSGESSGKAYKNARRNFEGGRESSVPRSAKDKAKWAEFGKRLPPTSYNPPEGGYVVTFAGSILIAGEYCEYRSFTRTITGDAAASLAIEASWSPIFDAYFEMSLADELCGPAEVSVSAAS